MTTFVNQTKNTSTWIEKLRHGKETILNDIANMTFTDVIFEDGTLLKDITFAQLVEQLWTKLDKSTSPTWTKPTRN